MYFLNEIIFDVRFSLLYGIFLLFLCWSCSVTRHVPKDDLLLNKVKIVIDTKEISKESLAPFIRQMPNQKIFGIFRLQLGVYNFSGYDSSKWINRFLQRAGEAPVIYDSISTLLSAKELQKEMINRGYTHAVIAVNTSRKKREINVEYKLTAGKPLTIKSYTTDIQDDTIKKALFEEKYPFHSTLSTGMNFNINLLDNERTQLNNYLRRRGFYNFSKEAFRFTADTTIGNYGTNLTVKLDPNLMQNDSIARQLSSRKIVRTITFRFSVNPLVRGSRGTTTDSLFYEGYRFLFVGKPEFSPYSLVSNTFIFPNSYYSDKAVEDTYAALNALPPVKYVNIGFRSRRDNTMNCIITVSPDKPQQATVNVEGTNSGGNLGAALDFSYQHKNIFHGAQLFKFHVRGSYESLGGMSNILSYDAKEIATDVSVKYPTFLFPFLNRDFKRGLQAATTFSVGYSYQIRPEFVRTLANANVKYSWNHTKNTVFTLDPFDFSYIYLPRIDRGFDSVYLKPSSPLIFSYQNQLILQAGFGILHNTQQGTVSSSESFSNWRWNISEAGNLLNALCYLFNAKKDSTGAYRLFNLRFAQYVKTDFDYAYNQKLSQDNRLVYHIAFGIACPYGNTEIIPYEQRYFGGGANGVRGWTSYTLGPGAYSQNVGAVDLVHHAGDIKLLANIEYRFKMFWRFEGATFFDAGNIWTIRNYDFQPDGVFKFNSFYKQIAMSYGLGLRLNFDYFLIRVDVGHKLYNPAYTASQCWVKPLSNINDMALFFSVGYPF